MKYKVPLTGIEKENRRYRRAIRKRIDQVIKENRFILGKEVEEFERTWAEACRAKYAVGVSNGTDALFLALYVLNIGCGKEVITVPNTFIATTEAIRRTGAKINFVDVNEDDLLMDLNCLEERISNKTKVVIPVHLHGQIIDMPRLFSISLKHNLLIIEDAAQAHLAEYASYPPGELGDAACFSFFPSKNLGAFGDAGAIVTNHSGMYIDLKKIRDHGRESKYTHDMDGFNCRMDGIQAAVLNAKLPFLDEGNTKRRLNAQKYLQLLPKEIKSLEVSWEAKPAFHHYVILTERRNELRDFLKQNGVETGIHYPIPLHLQPVYRSLGFKEGSFPVAEKTAKEKLSLPLFADMENWEIEYVCDKIKEFYKKNGGQ